MASWFECKVRYDKLQENGSVKKMSDVFLTDSLSITEAVARITKEQAPFISGDFIVSSAKSTKIAEIFRDDSADKWYLVKVAFITIDEKTQKEKRSAINYMINAGSLNGAVKNIDEVMSQSMVDYLIVSVNETTIMDVFEYKKKEKNDKPEYEQQ